MKFKIVFLPDAIKDVEKFVKSGNHTLIMSISRNILVVTLLSISSCNFGPKKVCDDILVSELYKLDSISSGLPKSDAINSASLRIKGELEKNISINGIPLPAGKIDTLFEPSDHYSPMYLYEIENPDGGKVELELCVTFYHGI